MPKFCTRCGQGNESDARFCEGCGNAFTASPSIPLAAPNPPSTLAPRQKTLVFAGIGLVVLVIAGGILVYFLAPEAATAQNFARAIDAELMKDKRLAEQHYCLSNFDYSRDPVYTNRYDSGTNDWLAILVEAGIYGRPQIHQGGWLSANQFVYRITPEGRKQVSGKHICFATGVKVDQVKEGFTLQNPDSKTPFAEVTYTVSYESPAAWTQSAKAREALPEFFGPVASRRIYVERHDGKWAVVEAPGQ
jgi:hypothetical protein